PPARTRRSAAADTCASSGGWSSSPGEADARRPPPVLDKDAAMRLALTHVYCWPDVWRGGERILHESAAALARRGHEVTVLSSSTRPGEAIEDGVRVVRLRRPRGHDLGVEARFGRRVFAHLLRGRFDAVHSLGPSDAAASIVAARMGAKHRTVYTNLGYPDRRYWRTRPDWLH